MDAEETEQTCSHSEKPIMSWSQNYIHKWCDQQKSLLVILNSGSLTLLYELLHETRPHYDRFGTFYTEIAMNSYITTVYGM